MPRSPISRPTLTRPPSAPEKPAQTNWQEREAVRIATEAPWREVLNKMSRQELVELAVAGAWESKRHSAHLERLRAKYLAHRKGRQKGGRNAHFDQQQAKELIETAWMAEAASGRRVVIADFARRMSDKYKVITDPRTIEGWVRRWKAAQAERPTHSTASESGKPPEIFDLLGFVPSR